MKFILLPNCNNDIMALCRQNQMMMMMMIMEIAIKDNSTNSAPCLKQGRKEGRKNGNEMKINSQKEVTCIGRVVGEIRTVAEFL